MPSKPSAEATKSTINIKVLGVLAIMLLAAILWNMLGGGANFAAHGARTQRFHEAAIPLQKRPRKSKYDHGETDPDIPEQVVVGPAKASAAAVPPKQAMAATVATAATMPAAATAVAKLPQPDSKFAARVDAEASALTKDLEGLSCHAREGFDIAGDAAYVWGLAFNVASAAECCAACAAQRQMCGQSGSRGKPFWRASRRARTQGRCSGAPGVCNAWVFCPGSDDIKGAEDRCFSYTIHNHTKGECWLKHEANESVPIAAGPTLPMRMRRAARKDWPWAVATDVWPWEVPEKIPWQAGIVQKRGAPVWHSTRLPDWHHKFCNGKNGPC